MTNRDANRGGCAHSCRWNYDLVKDGITYNPKGDYFAMSSKDLCAIKAIPRLMDIGVDSFKIEGRMKSLHYIATVVNAYRRIIDEYEETGKVLDYNVYIIVCSQNCHITMLKLTQYRMYGGHNMKKPTKRDTINLFFSAFLIIAFIVCAHFFAQYASALSQPFGSIIPILVYAVFGLLVFYATRVGDGRAVKRFSLVTLIVMVLPSLYIIVASLAPGLPLYDVFSNASGSGLSVIVTLASIALGYGIPYSFLSGFELADEDVVEDEIWREGDRSLAQAQRTLFCP